MFKKLLIIQIILTIFVVGCGQKKIYTENADELYARAMEELEEEGGGFPWVFNDPSYDNVLEALREIQLRHTFSPYATLAELRTADVYYKKKQYEQAITEYSAFLKRHPGHKETEHAMYYLAMSYYNMKKSADRDPTFVRNALDSLNEYKYRYPDSERIEKVNKRIMKCRNILAEREIYIGDYYKRKDNYKAAYERYNNVLEKYPDTKYVGKARKKLEEAREDASDDDGLI